MAGSPVEGKCSDEMSSPDKAARMEKLLGWRCCIAREQWGREREREREQAATGLLLLSQTKSNFQRTHCDPTGFKGWSQDLVILKKISELIPRVYIYVGYSYEEFSYCKSKKTFKNILGNALKIVINPFRCTNNALVISWKIATFSKIVSWVLVSIVCAHLFAVWLNRRPWILLSALTFTSVSMCCFGISMLNR